MSRSAIHRLRRAVVAAAATLAAPLALAGYFQWEMVELPVSSGAACGDGSPYRFFVNRAPAARDLVMVFEGGGACWDQNACLGVGRLGAANPEGIPVDYMQTANVAYGLVTPFNARNSPQAVPTQTWNMVFMPYCTGDVHAGSTVAIYDDADPANPRVQYHQGQNNVRLAAQWLHDHWGSPAQLLLTGYSAGGVGATVTYPIVRAALQPSGNVSLLADSGPLVPAPRSGTADDYPALPMHNRIREAWGLDDPGGLLADTASALTGFDPDDLGSFNRSLALSYPNDRFGYMVFTRDTNFSAFSYEKFYADLYAAPNPIAYREALFARWWPDLDRWTAELDGLGNVALYRPYFRNFNESHCLTIIDFSGTGIEAAGLPDLGVFVDNTLQRGAPIRAVEPENNADFTQPLSPFMQLVKLLSSLLG